MRLWQREQSAHDLSVINHPKAQRYRACSTMRHHTIRVRVGPRGGGQLNGYGFTFCPVFTF